MTKLSFIKLDIEIMNDSKIKLIRKMPDGPKLFELWIGLMCLGMKSGKPGCIEIGDGIPFTSRMLSAELDIPENTIELGLQIFHELRMIENLEDSTIFLSNFEKHQELEKIEIKRINERERKRAYRDKIKLLSQGTGQGQDGDSTKCPVLDEETDIHKEEDIEIKGKQTEILLPPNPEDFGKESKPKKYDPSDDLVFFKDPDFQEVWIDYKSVRTKKKAVNSDRAIKTIISKLLKYSGGDKDIAIKIIAKSADSGWSDIWPDKDHEIKPVIKSTAEIELEKCRGFLIGDMASVWDDKDREEIEQKIKGLEKQIEEEKLNE